MVKYKSRKKPKAKKNLLIPSSVKHFLPCEEMGDREDIYAPPS